MVAFALDEQEMMMPYSINSLENHMLSERMQVEKASLSAYTNIINALTTRNDYVLYPSNYGGAFLNEDGKLVILITPSDNTQLIRETNNSYERLLSSVDVDFNSALFNEKSLEFQRTAQELMSLSDGRNESYILFREARYSYMYLSELIEELNHAICDNSNMDSIWNYITGFALLTNKNAISIQVFELNDSKIDRFRYEVSSSGALVFENSDGFAMSESIRAGQQANTGSIGFRARSGSFRGFVTTGHGGIRTGSSVSQMSVGPIGVCVIGRADNNVDAAFVRTDHIAGPMTDITHGGRRISGRSDSPLLGTTVFMEGWGTNSISMGNITSTNATVTYSITGGTITRRNMIVANYMSRQNDSGGIVYDVQNRVLGIHTAAGTINRYIERVRNIEDWLGVTFY